MRWSLAFVQVPGPFEKLPSIYYISPPDESLPPAARAAAIPGDANLLITTAHEVWPGHQLEYQHTREATSPLGRLFRTGTFSEGWAHYAEEMVVVLRERLGQLEAAVVVGAGDPVHDAGIEQHRDVPVRRADRQRAAGRGLDDLGDRERPPGTGQHLDDGPPVLRVALVDGRQQGRHLVVGLHPPTIRDRANSPTRP